MEYQILVKCQPISEAFFFVTLASKLKTLVISTKNLQEFIIIGKVRKADNSRITG